MRKNRPVDWRYYRDRQRKRSGKKGLKKYDKRAALPAGSYRSTTKIYIWIDHRSEYRW